MLPHEENPKTLPPPRRAGGAGRRGTGSVCGTDPLAAQRLAGHLPHPLQRDCRRRPAGRLHPVGADGLVQSQRPASLHAAGWPTGNEPAARRPGQPGQRRPHARLCGDPELHRRARGPGRRQRGGHRHRLRLGRQPDNLRPGGPGSADLHPLPARQHGNPAGGRGNRSRGLRHRLCHPLSPVGVCVCAEYRLQLAGRGYGNRNRLALRPHRRQLLCAGDGVRRLLDPGLSGPGAGALPGPGPDPRCDRRPAPGRGAL